MGAVSPTTSDQFFNVKREIPFWDRHEDDLRRQGAEKL